MKVLFALYDKNDYLVKVGFSLKEIGFTGNVTQSRRKKGNAKLYTIPLEPQEDIFKEEDEIFIQEEKDNVFTIKEIAKMQGVNERTIYRQRLKRSRK